MHQNTSRLCRFGAIAGMAAPAVLALVAGTLGFIQTRYDPVTQLMSELGETGAPYASIMNTGFVMTGLLMVLFSYSISVLIGKSLPGAIGSWLIVMAGISFIGMGIFSCDAGCEPLSLPGQVHLQLGLLASVAAVLAAFLLGYSMWSLGRWKWYWQYSVITGIVIVLLLPVFVFAGTYDGLVQRIIVGILFLWMEVLAIRIFHVCRNQGEDAPQAPESS